MDVNEDLDGVEANELDAETKAYFESGGEKLPKEAAEQPQPEADKPADAVSPDKAAQAAVEGEKQPTTVPIRALHEAREELKEYRTKSSEYEKKLAVLEDRWATLLSMQQQQEQQPADQDPEPDPNKDIFAHNAWLARQLQRERQIREDSAKQTAEQQRAAEGERQVWNFWHQEAASYKAATPEFEDAVKFASDFRSNQLKAMAALYPQFGTDEGIVQQINSELRDLVIKAAQSGQSPAKVVHELAKSWGYKGKAPEIDPAKVIADVNKGAPAEVSLSGMGGGAAPGPKSAEDVASMSPAEFDAWLSKNGSKGFKRLMGGG